MIICFQAERGSGSCIKQFLNTLTDRSLGHASGQIEMHPKLTDCCSDVMLEVTSLL